MFNFFFKKKNKFDFDFSGIGVDMHSHLIPGIDDGAKTVEDSIALIRGLQDLGFKKIITTPHIYKEYYPNTKDGILRGLENLKPALKEAGIEIPIEVAAEYYLDEHFEQLLEQNDLLTVNKNYVLVEMSFFGAPPKLFQYIFQIQAKGYRPILAHPERYVFYKDNFSEFEKLKEAGCLLQMNLLSATGYYNKMVESLAKKLIDHNLIDFIGTDMHHQRHLDAAKNAVGQSSKIQAYLQNYPFRNKELL